jgi:bifunctional DNA-binding transcriptional regulator/antitoxin component of YhaV-PrlF toxin-antitoxin module
MPMGDRGRVVIPQAIRESQHLQVSNSLLIFEGPSGMSLLTRDQLEAHVYKNLKDPQTRLSDELIADRRRAARLEADDS